MPVYLQVYERAKRRYLTIPLFLHITNFSDLQPSAYLNMAPTVSFSLDKTSFEGCPLGMDGSLLPPSNRHESLLPPITLACDGVNSAWSDSSNRTPGQESEFQAQGTVLELSPAPSHGLAMSTMTPELQRFVEEQDDTPLNRTLSKNGSDKILLVSIVRSSREFGKGRLTDVCCRQSSCPLFSIRRQMIRRE
jgi:hypothetical protein